jgi:hypothetical protein
MYNKQIININAQLYTPFYHLRKAWQIQYQDPYTPVIKSNEGILNKENIKTCSILMYTSFFGNIVMYIIQKELSFPYPY